MLRWREAVRQAVDAGASAPLGSHRPSPYPSGAVQGDRRAETRRVNLLITNAQEFQAYAIAWSLRAEADRIVITEGGDSVGSTGFRGLVAYSRAVDARYHVPHFADD